MMVMYPRCGLVRAVNSVSKHSSVSRSSSPVTRIGFPASGFRPAGIHGFARRVFYLGQQLRELSVRRRSADQRNVGRALENLFALLLRDAAQHAKRLALLFILLVIGEPVENFLLGLVADGAGVVENQVGLLDRLHLAIAFLHQRADDLFGVVCIHLAAEGFEVESLLRIVPWNSRHIGKV